MSLLQEPWPRRPCHLSTGYQATACGIEHTGDSITIVAHLVTCPQCLATDTHRAAVVEQVLASTLCPTCTGTGTLSLLRTTGVEVIRCPRCDGTGRDRGAAP